VFAIPEIPGWGARASTYRKVTSGPAMVSIKTRQGGQRARLNKRLAATNKTILSLQSKSSLGDCEVRSHRSSKLNLKTKDKDMLKFYVKTSEAVRRLRTDQDGVVSFEYVIVAACIVASVALAFGTSTTAGIGLVLKNAITAIGTAVSTATSA
jgi:pilus assembly protein Flp/PilA